jgi:hypothetical protein
MYTQKAVNLGLGKRAREKESFEALSPKRSNFTVEAKDSLLPSALMPPASDSSCEDPSGPNILSCPRSPSLASSASSPNVETPIGPEVILGFPMPPLPSLLSSDAAPNALLGVKPVLPLLEIQEYIWPDEKPQPISPSHHKPKIVISPQSHVEQKISFSLPKNDPYILSFYDRYLDGKYQEASEAGVLKIFRNFEETCDFYKNKNIQQKRMVVERWFKLQQPIKLDKLLSLEPFHTLCEQFSGNNIAAIFASFKSLFQDHINDPKEVKFPALQAWIEAQDPDTYQKLQNFISFQKLWDDFID